MPGSQGANYPFDRGKHLIVVVELRADADERTQENPRYCLIVGWIGSQGSGDYFMEGGIEF